MGWDRESFCSYESPPKCRDIGGRTVGPLHFPFELMDDGLSCVLAFYFLMSSPERVEKKSSFGKPEKVHHAKNMELSDRASIVSTRSVHLSPFLSYKARPRNGTLSFFFSRVEKDGC